MQTMQSILTQIGLTVADSIWQMAVLWLLYKLFGFMGNFRADTKFKLALTLSMAGTIIFLVSVSIALFASEPILIHNEILSYQNLLPASMATQMNTWLGALYLVMLVFYCIKGNKEWAYIRQAQYLQSVNPPPFLKAFTTRYAYWMEIPRKVKLVVSSVDVPSTFGWLKPVILLPASCLANLSPQHLEAILLHELAHIKRNDYLWGLALLVSEKILWFNPFLLNIVKEARLEAENACDDWVLQFEYAPKEYAFALLQIAQSRVTTHALSLSVTGNNNFQLYGRIKRILNQSDANPLPSWKNICAGILLFFFAFQFQQNDKGQTSNNPFISPITNLNFSFPQNNGGVWENRVLQAKLSIFRAAVGKKENINLSETTSITKKIRYKKTDRKETNFAEQEFMVKEKESQAENKIVHSAGWSNDMQETNVDSALHIAWDRFDVLLNKLDKQGRLNEHEWKELTYNVAVHTTFKNAIDRYAVLQRNPLQSALATTDEQGQEEILLIIYDEASQTLAASFVNKYQLKEEYHDLEISDHEQRVIFMHKKAKKTAKIISL